MANFLLIAGTSTIAGVVAQQLVEQDHQVHITSTDSEKAEQHAKSLGVEFSVLDATDFDAVNDVFSAVSEKNGPIDGVANFAGSLWLKNAMQTSAEQYQQVIAANLTTSFAVVRAAEKYMSDEGGAVLLMSSAAALTGLSNHEAISAAKAGVIGLTLAAASSFASNNIRVNALAPGLVDTKLTEQLTKNDMARKVSENMHPLGRLGRAEDIARAAVFLLDPKNSWITGQVLAVDGGLSHVHTKVKA